MTTLSSKKCVRIQKHTHSICCNRGGDVWFCVAVNKCSTGQCSVRTVLKARIRTSGGQYYHQFNKSSFIIVSLLPTKANHLPLVIGVLSIQHRSLGINEILEHRTLVLCSACGFYRFWNIC